MAVEVARVAEEAEEEPVDLLLLHREDVRVLARARADGLVEEAAELAEARAVGPSGVSQAAVPSDSAFSEVVRVPTRNDMSR